MFLPKVTQRDQHPTNQAVVNFVTVPVAQWHRLQIRTADNIILYLMSSDDSTSHQLTVRLDDRLTR